MRSKPLTQSPGEQLVDLLASTLKTVLSGSKRGSLNALLHFVRTSLSPTTYGLKLKILTEAKDNEVLVFLLSGKQSTPRL
jgi:hypothetical protein